MTEPFRWTAHPAAERPAAAAGLAAILIGIGVAGVSWSGAPVFGVVAALLVAGFMLPFLLPTRYEAGEEGLSIASAGRTRVIKWSSVKNLYVHATGVHLSPFDRPSPLDPFRGAFVLYGREKERVLDALRARVPETNGPPGSPPEGPAASA
ncbi:MAG: hypothetical protein AAB434_09065 [Planctomycetota bacterium]